MEVRDAKKRFFARVLNFVLYLVTLPFRVLGFPQKPSNEEPKSFLISRLDHIGDVALSTPIYRSLNERFPNAKIAVLCGSWAVSLLKHNPYVSNLIVIDCPWWASIRHDAKGRGLLFLKDLLRTLRIIKNEQFDVFIDLRGDIRQIFLFGWLTGIRTRISYTRSGGKFLLTQPFAYTPGVHELEANYTLLSPFNPVNKYRALEIFTVPAVKASLWTKVEGILSLHEPYVVFFNGGRSSLRKLSPQLSVELCRSIVSAYSVKICMVGDLNDKQPMDEVASKINRNESRVLNLSGRLELLEVKELIDRAVLFIGTDSAISQLSSATSTPSIWLFGPVCPSQSGPFGANKHTVFHKYSCCPCLQRVCAENGSSISAKCMEDITVHEILQKSHLYLKPYMRHRFSDLEKE